MNFINGGTCNMANNYPYDEGLLETLSDTTVNSTGMVFALTKEAVENLKTIFNVQEVVLVGDHRAFEAVVDSEEGQIVLSIRWDLYVFGVEMVAIKVADQSPIANAFKRCTGEFNEGYGNFKDFDLKNKIRNWFDKISVVNPSTLKMIGHLYQQASEENVAPQQPEAAPTQSADIPKIDAEMVGVQN